MKPEVEPGITDRLLQVVAELDREYDWQTCNGMRYNMDSLQLNKILYYAQGWRLALMGESLFDDVIVRGPNGPRVPAVHALFGNSPKRPTGIFQGQVDSDLVAFVKEIVNTHGAKSGPALARFTQKDWCVSETPEGSEITQESIRQRFEEILIADSIKGGERLETARHRVQKRS